jgi:phosphatidylinositol alpha-mannosyltransferase
VGADPLSLRWLARRQRLSLDGVDLLGGLSEGELTAELEAASLLVAPSLGGESFGMVLTRAFACATPVVASDIEGYAQVADHRETGILVPPGDVRALGEAVVELLENEERRRAYGAAAREAAEPYSWDRIGRQLVDIYERLAAPAEAIRAAA